MLASLPRARSTSPIISFPEIREGLAGIAALEAEIARLRTAKAAVDETLAGRTTALAGSEDAIGDLKKRLEAVELHGREQEERLTGLRNQKAAVDESLSARTEARECQKPGADGLPVSG